MNILFFSLLGWTFAANGRLCRQIAAQEGITTRVRTSQLPQKILYERLPNTLLIRRAGASDALGITESSLHTSFQFRTVEYETDGVICVYIEEVIFQLGIASQKVFIDDRYPKSSCAYRAILQHENLHVAINNNTFAKYKSSMLDAVQDSFSEVTYTWFQSSQEYNAGFDAWINTQKKISKLEKLKKRMRKEREKANSRIDTKNSYRSVYRKCSDW